jgi:putative Mn2+ efflux pump MntP
LPMPLIEILLIALALAADAFTVGVAVGMSHRRPRQIFRLSFHFGLFQALLPLMGAFFGVALSGWIGSWSHWAAFGLLLFIGGRMILGTSQNETATKQIDLTRGLSLVSLSLAVSIDALAVGLTLGLEERGSIALSVAVIGATAALLTLTGMLLAGRVNLKSKKLVGIVAGAVLIGIGVKMLVDKLM